MNEHDHNNEHLSGHGHPHEEDVHEHDEEKHAAHGNVHSGDHSADGGQWIRTARLTVNRCY